MSPQDPTDRVTEQPESFVDLGQTCEIRYGWTSAATEQGSLLMVRSTDIAKGEIDWPTVPYCKSEPPDPTGFLLRSGDILVARTGSVGNTAYVGDPPPAIFASYLLRLRPNSDWDGRFIALFLQSPDGREALLERSHGATIQNLSGPRLATIQIPSFPLSHQVRVADRLMKMRSLVVQAIKRLDSVLRRVPELERQTLSIALSKIPEAQSGMTAWPRLTVRELTENRDRFRIPLNADERETRQGTIPYYGASGVIDHVDGKTHEGLHLLVTEDGRTLLNRNAPIAFVVRGKFWANNHVHVLRVPEQVIPEYVALQLNDTDLHPFLTGTAQAKLTKRALDEILITVPPLEVQEEIVRTASQLAESWVKIRRDADGLKVRTSAAWDELLAAAFTVGGPEVRAIEEGQQEALSRILADVETSVKAPSTALTGGSSNRRGRSAEARTTQARRTRPVADIREALKDRPEGLTPEQLFDAVDWPQGSGMDAVDAYYAALKRAVAEGSVREVRRDSDSIRLVSI
jgi:type I restriction enzyme S subunit